MEKNIGSPIRSMQKKNFFSKASLCFWSRNLGASCCHLPVEVAEGVEPFCERGSTLLWICQLFKESDCQTSLESCSLSWGHATSLYVMSTSLQIKQTFFPDLPDSKFSYGLTLIWHSLTHGSTISLPVFLPRDYWQWHGLDKEIHLIGFRSRTAHIGLPQPIFAYPGSSASFFQA